MNTQVLRTIYLTTLLLVIISVFSTRVINELIIGREINVVEEDIVYFNKTIMFLRNLTICINARKPCTVINVFDLLKTHSFLNKRFNELLNKKGINYITVARIETYLNVSRVNNILYNVSMDLSIIWNDVVKTIDYLELMRISSALETFRSNKFILEKIIRDLEQSVIILTNTNCSNFIYLNQTYFFQLSVMSVSNLYELLKEYYELMNILDSRREELFNTVGLMNLTQALFINIDLGKLQEFSIKVSNFLTQLRTIAEAGSGVIDGVVVTVPTTPGAPYD